MTLPPPHERDDLDDDEKVGVAYMLKLAEAEQAGERATVVIGPFAAMNIIGLLQLATRHPDMPVRQKQIARDFVHQLEPLFAGTYGETIIRQGGHPEFDR